MPDTQTPWPHAPTHILDKSGAFLVTGSTLHKVHHFHGPDRLDLLQRELLGRAFDFGWQLEAWAIFPNHYHFVARTPLTATDATSLATLIRTLHARTARVVNERDQQPSRVVWHNYWETRLTHQTSYLARLNYVHQNPVRHGLVQIANAYRWCSAAWFERTCAPSIVRSIYRFKCDRVHVEDGFEVEPSALAPTAEK